MPPTPSDSPPVPLSRPARFVRGASLVSLTVGTAVFFSWLLDISAIKSVVPGTSTMKANSSLLFALAGAALWLAVGKHERRAVRSLAAILIAVAGLTLAEYATGISLGLDQLIVRDLAPVPPTAPPGRMGIN